MMRSFISVMAMMTSVTDFDEGDGGKDRHAVSLIAEKCSIFKLSTEK